MAGGSGRFWARYKTLILFWGITLLFILGGVIIQFYEADLANRHSVSERVTVGNVQVTVVYPTYIFLSSVGAPEQVFILQVSAPETISYTVNIVNHDGLLFYNQDEDGISPNWQGQGNTVFMANVKAFPMPAEVIRSLELELQVNSVSHLIILEPISNESLGQSRWRIGLGIFAQNIALPLGLLSVIVGWIVSYLGKETEKAESEFREKLGSLSNQFAKDPLLAMVSCLDLKRYAEKKHLGTESLEVVENAVCRLFQMGVLKKIIRQVGVLIEEGEEEAVLPALKRIEIFLEKFSGLDIDGKLLSCFLSINNWLVTNTAFDKVINPIFLMWDTLDVNSAALIVYLLDRFPRNPSKSLIGKVKKQIETKPSRKRLLRYQQLSWMIEAYSLTLPGQYKIPYPGIISK